MNANYATNIVILNMQSKPFDITQVDSLMGTQ